MANRHRQHKKDTRLSQYVWTKNNEGKACSIQWAVHRRAAAYSNKSKRCNLCLAEKLAIAQAPKRLSLNKRSELVSKCRHENRYYLRNFKPSTAITKLSKRQPAPVVVTFHHCCHTLLLLDLPHDAVIHVLHCCHLQLLDLRHAAAIYTLICEYINQY